MKSQQLAQAGARPAVQVSLPAFEGPFDLLIYLVERDKLDIYDIPIAEITSSYIESLKDIAFDPELASDFIFMAAYLLELKSRALLPRSQRIHLAEEPDPRQELIIRLMEYKRFKELAAGLEALAVSSSLTHFRRPSPALEANELRPLVSMNLDQLFSAFVRAMEESRVEVRELPARGLMVADKMDALRERLKGGSARFEELVAGKGLTEIIVTFLAVLELVRLGEANVYQEQFQAPIVIEAAEKDDSDERAG